MKFKLQILQWCILTGDPYCNHKLKNNNYVCNKDANALLVFRVRKVLADSSFIFLVDEPTKTYIPKCSKRCVCVHLEM